MAYVGSVATNSGTPTVTTINITKYTSTASGHMMLIGVAARNATVTITPDTGWTAVRAADVNSSGPMTEQLFWKLAGGSEPSTYTFTFSTAVRVACWHGAWSGIDTTSPIDTSSGATGGSNTSAVATSVTASAACDLIYSGAAATSNTWTAPSGMTERIDDQSTNGSANASITMATESVSSGATGTRTGTLSGSAQWVAVLVALKPASAATWNRWVRFERPYLERYKTTTLSISPTSGTTNWYLRTSEDGSTWSYFAGPVTSSRILTSVASDTAAQAAAISSATLGNSSASRVDLPSIKQARYVEVWLKNTGATSTVREFYPRRLVQSDDIEAESIAAINIAAASITADRLSVTQLSAITADMGSITAGTITGATIQTATSGARVVLSSAANGGLIGYGASDTYSTSTGSGTYQLLWKKTDGKLYFGGGKGILGVDGLSLFGVDTTSTTIDVARSITWYDTSAPTTKLASVSSRYDTTPATPYQALEFRAYRNGSRVGAIRLVNEVGGGLESLVAVDDSGVFIRPASGLTTNIDRDVSIGGGISGSSLRVTGGLSLGTASGATTGSILASGTQLQMSGSGATASIGDTLETNTTLYLVGGLASTQIHLYEDAATDGHVYLWAGEPGVTFTAGGVGYNWHPVSGSAMGRIDTGQGAGYVRFGQGIVEFDCVTTAGVDARVLRLDSDKNAGFNGQSYGGGQAVIFIANRVAAPSSNPSNGGILYVESGALKYRGSSGTVTTIANA